MSRKEPITLRLDYPPSVNHIYGQRGLKARGKRKYLLPEVEQYRTSVMISVIEQYPKFLDGGFVEKERLAITVHAYPPDRRVRDLDDYHKALLDAITESGLWLDDNQVDQLHTYRGVPGSGRVRVEICDAGPLMPEPN